MRHGYSVKGDFAANVIKFQVTEANQGSLMTKAWWLMAGVCKLLVAGWSPAWSPVCVFLSKAAGLNCFRFKNPCIEVGESKHTRSA